MKMAAMSLPLNSLPLKFPLTLTWLSLSGSKYLKVGNGLREGLGAGLLPFPFPCSSFSQSTRKRLIHFSGQSSNILSACCHYPEGIKVASLLVSNDNLCANNVIGVTTIRASISPSTHICSRTFADVSAPGKPNRRAVNQKARREFRSFEDARAYVHTLGLKSHEEWHAWRASGARPHDIPSNPYHEYASSGWLSYGDFLGYAVGKVAGEFRTFEEARAYVHTLGLKSTEEWNAWSSSGARPYDIPSSPHSRYASSGWLSYGDFLGYAVGKVTGEFRTFEDARAYVHTLGLKSQEEWDAWSASSTRPYDIPSHPDMYYASSGWLSYGDFLGYAVGKVAGEFRTFEDARAYVHTLGLKSTEEWNAWRASGARPHDIPSNPQTYYASSGWLSYPDFIGYAVGKEAQVRQRTDFRSFEDARAYVHTLDLKGKEEWRAWSASGARPYDIPSHPHTYYASSGWLSYPDFLGYKIGKVASEFRSFEDARAYVHTLGLKSHEEWVAWSASGARPYDVPSHPHTYYASSGWLSFPDFLGYAVGKKARSLIQ
ncbi:methyltransferase domain-containing protein [Pycnococcus provasolii]